MAKHKLNTSSNTTWQIGSSGDTWILGDKGKITGDLVYGIHAAIGITTATVNVNGVINAENPNASTGVFLQSDSGRIIVGEDAHVSGSGAALHYDNGSNTGKVTIDNNGVLGGGIWGITAVTAWHGADIRNDGRILAADMGIQSVGAGANIINTGTIKSQSVGVAIDAGQVNGDPLDAENASYVVNTGKIIGSNYSISSPDVAANIRNKGVLSGIVELDDGNDVLNNRGGTVNGNIYGDGGNDVFKMTGGKLYGIIFGGLGDDVVTLDTRPIAYKEYAGEGQDTVRINASYNLGANIENLTLLGKASHTGIGNELDNVLTGNKGANALYGFEGADTLSGGKGNDTLTGGEDADLFVFKLGGGRDTITDFAAGQDLIDLRSFTGIDSVSDFQIGHDGNNAIITFNDADRLIIRGVQDGVIDMNDFLFT